MSFTITTPVDEAHLKLLLLDGLLCKNLLAVGADSDKLGLEYGRNLYEDIAFGVEDLLTHLSKVKVASVYNDHAKDSLESYQQASEDDKVVHLQDVMDSVTVVTVAELVAPTTHYERGRAYQYRGMYHLANGELDLARYQFEMAIEVFKQVDQTAEMFYVQRLLSSCRSNV